MRNTNPTTAAKTARRSRTRQLASEPLESRQMLTVSLNAAGFTVVTPTTGDKVIYCSSSAGSDKNNGLSSTTPVATVAAAVALMQNDTGDQLLLKAGDSWHTSFGYWRLSGASASNPMVIGSYGAGARPIIMSGTSAAFETGSSSSPEIDYLDILGIEFLADGRDPAITPKPAVSDPTGLSMLARSTDLLVENCLVQDYEVDVTFEDYLGPLTNVEARRNIIIDAWSNDSNHSQGLYALGTANLTLDGNVFDHDGFNSSVSGAVATVYNHDCYISSANTGVVIENNTFADAAETGCQDRPGGIVEDNLFLDDPVGLTYGLVNGASTTPGGVSGQVSGNVFIGASVSGAMSPQEGIQVGNIKPNSGTTINNNIFSSAGSGEGAAIAVMYGIAQSDPQDSVGINNLGLADNTFYNWTTGIDYVSGMTPGGSGLYALNGVSMTGNQFENMSSWSVENAASGYLPQETWSGNEYYSAKQYVNGASVTPVGTVLTKPFPYPNPGASVATYDASALGGAGTDAAFMALARRQSEAAWQTNLTAPAVDAYIQSGFNLAPTLASSQLGDGTAQRSSISSITLTFSQAVNFSRSSFTLYQEALNADGSLNANGAATDVTSGLSATSSNGGTTWTLTVVPGGSLDRTTSAAAGQTNAGILLDGIYQLVLHGSAITDAATSSSQFNSGADQIVQFYSPEANNRTGGASNYFHSLYGDTNGDGSVDLTDYRTFSADFGTNMGDTNYSTALDYNGDGAIDLTDLRQFKMSYGQSYSY